MPILQPTLPIMLELGLGLAVALATALGLQVWLAATPVWSGGSVIAYLALAAVVYRYWPAGRADFGWANRVTLARAALVAVLIGALALPELFSRHGLVLAALAMSAIALDGLDGWLARALGGATPFGARFDMEVDALLILVLSVAVLVAGQAGPWVLAIGGLRYAFVAAGRIRPWWNRPLPENRWRKFACVVQGVVLAAVLTPWLQPPLTTWLLAGALAALLHSFGRDALWLLRARNARPDPAIKPSVNPQNRRSQ